MKKIKSILCMTFVLIVGCLTLVACGPQSPEEPQTPTNTTITLAEAKTTIINALAIEETQAQTFGVSLMSALQNEGNRNLLEKLGKIEISMSSTTKYYTSNEVSLQTTMQGQYEYSNGEFKKYLMSMTDSTEGSLSEYTPDYETVYIYAGTSVVEQTITTKGALGYSDTMGSAYIQIFNALFTDKAFDMAYEEDVAKNITSNGYELVLDLSLKGYSRLLTLDSMTDEEFETYWTNTQSMYNSFPQELKDYQTVQVSINFTSSDEIIDATFTGNTGTFMDIDGNVTYYKSESQMKISNYTGEINEPKWVTDYLVSQTPSTMSLEEAKTIIVNALSTENTETQQLLTFASTTSSTNQNRNIFIKLNTVEIAMSGNFGDATTISGVAQRNLWGNWSKYSLQSGKYYEYFDGNTAYAKNDADYETTTFENSYLGGLILQSMDCLYIDLLFLDDAFDSIYGNTVYKTPSKDSYTLTMDIDMSKYVDYVMAQCELRDLPTEGLFGDGEYRQRNKDEGSVEVVISFDKNHNILGLDMTINSLGSDLTLHETKISIVKYNQDITQPQWVTDYLDNQQ